MVIGNVDNSGLHIRLIDFVSGCNLVGLGFPIVVVVAGLLLNLRHLAEPSRQSEELTDVERFAICGLLCNRLVDFARAEFCAADGNRRGLPAYTNERSQALSQIPNFSDSARRQRAPMLLQRLAARSSRLFAPAASRLLSPAAAAPILFTRGLAYHNRVQPFRAPQKWRWEPEPGQVAGAPHSNERPRPLYPGQKSLLRKLDEARIKRGEKPRNLVKTRKRIAHARHTHIARFRMRGRGPSPREKQVWEDPEQATRDAMIQFVDPYELDPDLAAPGRRWHAAEIRLKSNEDLQKLWVVLLKERNMLHSTRMLHKKRKTEMPHRGRIRDVRKSMAMIKVVLNERQVEKRARDMRIKHELHRERALDQIDFEGSTVWPPFIPNSERRLPLAQRFTFNVILRTADGEVPSVRPEPTNLGLEMYVDGEKIPDAKFDQHIVLRPHVPRRPEEPLRVPRDDTRRRAAKGSLPSERDEPARGWRAGRGRAAGDAVRRGRGWRRNGARLPHAVKAAEEARRDGRHQRADVGGVAARARGGRKGGGRRAAGALAVAAADRVLEGNAQPAIAMRSVCGCCFFIIRQVYRKNNGALYSPNIAPTTASTGSATPSASTLASKAWRDFGSIDRSHLKHAGAVALRPQVE